MQTGIMIEQFSNGKQDERLLDIYVDDTIIAYQRERYSHAIKKFEEYYGAMKWSYSVLREGVK